jgi:F0F1-type ATP synthase assembly protein I
MEFSELDDYVQHSIVWGLVVVIFFGMVCGTLALTAEHITAEHKATITACLEQHHTARECQGLR